MPSLSPLEGIDSSSRLLRTSIYLKNSLNQSEGEVKDLLDCVVPIVGASVELLPSGQIVIPDLQEIIKRRYSFSMPAFAVEHILSRLAQTGKVTYEKDQKSYYHAGVVSNVELKDEEQAEQKTSYIENEISNFSKTHLGINEPPLFSNWADILVYFMHPDSRDLTKLINDIKGSLISDVEQVLRRISSSFILDCERRSDQKAYKIIIEMYGGILLSDFLQNVQSTGSPDSYKSLTVFYDTSILLRLLGCSGPALRNANMEMHRDLQSLGCKTEYLQHNENEVITILDTVVGRYDAGQPIFGETGDALLDNFSGVNIGTLRALQNEYPEALARLGIFPSKYTFQNTKTQNFFQIDEMKFEQMLGGETSRGYSEQNRVHDTQSLAVVMRLRQNSRSNDLSSSRFVFVTSNTHFSRTARKYVRTDLGFTSRYVPPVLTHSQMSTAAWLSTESKLIDSHISAELLANCMSAQKLSKDWVEAFNELLDKASINEEDKTFLYAVRSVARDESLGNPTILRKLNATEMLKLAKLAEAERAEELRSQYELSLANQLADSTRKAREELQTTLDHRNENTAQKLADNLMRTVELILVVPATYVLVTGLGNFQPDAPGTWFQPIAFVVITTLAALDLLQFQPVNRLTRPVRQRLAKYILRTFYGKGE